MSTYIEDELQENAVVASVYFDYKDKESYSAKNIASNLLMQLVARFDEIPLDLIQIFEKKRKGHSYLKKMDELETWFLKCVDYLPPVFLILDALDECEDSAARSAILSFLGRLKGHGVRMFLTSRLDLPKPMNRAPVINIRAKDSDVDTYVRAKLDELEEEEISQELEEEIVHGIVQNAKGMYASLSDTKLISGFCWLSFN